MQGPYAVPGWGNSTPYEVSIKSAYKLAGFKTKLALGVCGMVLVVLPS